MYNLESNLLEFRPLNQSTQRLIQSVNIMLRLFLLIRFIISLSILSGLLLAIYTSEILNDSIFIYIAISYLGVYFCYTLILLIFTLKQPRNRLEHKRKKYIIGILNTWIIFIGIFTLFYSRFTEDSNHNNNIYIYLFLLGVYNIYSTVFAWLFSLSLTCCVLGIINRCENNNFGNNIAKYTILNTIEELTDVRIFSELITDNSNRIDTTSCCICIENFTQLDEVRILRCGHFFHTDCIIQWLRKNNACPYCRKDFTKDNLLDTESDLADRMNLEYDTDENIEGGMSHNDEGDLLISYLSDDE